MHHAAENDWTPQHQQGKRPLFHPMKSMLGPFFSWIYASSTAKSANSWHGTRCFLPSRVSNFVHHLWALTFLPYFELTLDTKNTQATQVTFKKNKQTNLKKKQDETTKTTQTTANSLLCSGEVGLGHRHCFHGIGLCCLLALQLASKGLNVLVGSLDSKDSTWIPTKKNTYSHWTLQLKEKNMCMSSWDFYLVRFQHSKASHFNMAPHPLQLKKKRKLPGKSASVSLVWSFTAVAWARVVSASMAWQMQGFIQFIQFICFFWIETCLKTLSYSLPILNWSTLVSKIIFCSNCITALPPVLFL